MPAKSFPRDPIIAELLEGVLRCPGSAADAASEVERPDASRATAHAREEDRAQVPAIHVVDRDAEVRESMRTLFESLGYRVVTYPSADEFLQQYSPRTRGCVLLDLHMPGTTGLEMQAKLAQLDAWLPVVFQTGHAEVASALTAMKQGAVGFLLKPAREQNLVEAVNRAMRREREGRGRHEAAGALRQRLAALTCRERDVLRHVLAGDATKATASALGIGERTVEAHRARAFTKLRVRSVPELVRMLDTLR